MQVWYPGLLTAVLLLSACSNLTPLKPPSPIVVLATNSTAGTDWDKVAEESKKSVVALTVEHGIFESFPNYLGKLWQRTKNLIADPTGGVPGLLGALLFGYLDLSYAEGSGFIISPAGHLLTNAHVVESGQRIAVRLDQEKTWRRAKVLASSPRHDIALLKIEGERFRGKAFRSLRFGNPEKIGEQVAVLGYPSRPWAHSNNPITMTRGIVSSLRLEIGEAATRFQTDAATNAGASGSPVLGGDGSVYGIVCEHARPSLLEDQTFAIPSSEIEKAGFIVIRAEKKN